MLKQETTAPTANNSSEVQRSLKEEVVTIKDINGEVIEVTNLEEALHQADTFRLYLQDSVTSAFNKEKKAYWQDIYEKLNIIKEKESKKVEIKTSNNIKKIKEMENTNQTQKQTIVIFKIGRGGSSYNAGHLSYKGVGNINDYTYDLFLSDENENEDTQWIDASGNEVGLPFINNGTGIIDLDGDYDTTYASFISELSEKEIDLIIKDKDSLVLREIAENKGFSDLDVELMKHFDDWQNALFCSSADSYLERNYEVLTKTELDKKSENERFDFLQTKGKYYVLK